MEAALALALEKNLTQALVGLQAPGPARTALSSVTSWRPAPG